MSVASGVAGPSWGTTLAPKMVEHLIFWSTVCQHLEFTKPLKFGAGIAPLSEHLQPVGRLDHDLPREVSTRIDRRQEEHERTQSQNAGRPIEAGRDGGVRAHLRKQAGGYDDGCGENDRDERRLRGGELP